MSDNDLTFSDFLSKFDQLGQGEWLTVYAGPSDRIDSPIFYSALIREDLVEKSLKDPSWDLRIGDGRPGFCFRFEGGKEIGSYYRHSDEGVEPLVMWRNFYGIKPGYWEISEEFRLYFDLYEDRAKGLLIKINDNGDEEEVALISDQEIKIKLRLVTEFLAVKRMRLALFFDMNRFSEKTLAELHIKESHKIKAGNDFVYSIGARPWNGFTEEGHRSHGFLLGKKLVAPTSDFKPRMFGSEKRQYVDFIIGVDEHGGEVLHTCEDERLANYFGKNPGAPQYVTPVFFRKEVLGKYYSQPSKFSVEDGYLRCGGLWGLRMDNNHRRYVMILLGDLGHLSYIEQLHWRSFNVASGKMSRTAFERGFEGKFADPENPALFFRQRFDSFQKNWEKKFGWLLFKPMNEGDAYHLKALRIPLTNEQKEFDEQVLTLTKILIDSLNEEQLQKELPVQGQNSKGLEKLEQFLTHRGADFPEMFEFLRKLQTLRSTAVAHRKGKNYEKVKDFFSIGKRELSLIFEDIVVNCIRVLNTLERSVLGSKPKT